MTQEEKAKRYDEAVKKVKDYYEGKTKMYSDVNQTLDFLFPELNKNEDERIRKAIICGMNALKETRKSETFATIPIDDCIAWLEKQREQKTIDNDGPKFHPGDWVIDNFGNTYQIESAAEIISEHIFGYTIVGGGYFNDNSNVRLWTIEDAKNGDVLATSAGAFIYNGKRDGISCPGSYCGINTLGRFQIGGERHWTGKKVYPATKEQRDTLFAKMKESGYKWDSEKKELNTIEQNSADKVEPEFREGVWVVNKLGDSWHIDSFDEKNYQVSDGKGNYNWFPISKQDEMHLWTIQDAKEGDVLAFNDDTIVIFKNLYNSSTFHSYCHIEDGIFDISKDDTPDWWVGNGFQPATKEQRDLFFQKMADASYEWDGDKKELKRIEQKAVDKVEPKFRAGNWYQCTKDFFGKGVTFDKNTAYYCAKEGCLQNQYGCHIAIVKDLYDNFKLWTIKDAKDGDVLYANGAPFIYKRHDKDYVYFYCGVNVGGYFIEANGIDIWDNNNKVYPATQEQRDLLFRKMKEAGWEWDNEKKELKKFEPKFNVDDWIVTDDSFGKIVRHVDEINFNTIREGYVVSDENGLIYEISFDSEHKWHKWTIQEAEDGDVLSGEIDGDKYIFSFKKLNGRWIETHNVCYCETTNECLEDVRFCNHYQDFFKPASKEERDILLLKTVNHQLK